MPRARLPRLRWLLLLAVVAAGATAYVWQQEQAAEPQYVTAPVGTGDILRAIVATGAVNPVVTVEVGSYVSGVIQNLYCDYNSEVKAGQLCAKIDPRPFQVVVDQASANLQSAQAQLNKDQAGLAYASINYERDRKLQKQGIVSEDTVDSDKNAFDQGTAQVALDQSAIAQRAAELHAAQVNLDYTNITSPVDGTVVLRDVSVGQTVAASFQTPTLFLIAQDLTKMQVDTNVSESDVGGARVGEQACFTVEAYLDQTFCGQVSQVRRAPITVQNVVTYDVVVSVDNPDLKLLPGMTANTRIITDERKNVVRVPLQALKFSPEGFGGRGRGTGSTRAESGTEPRTGPRTEPSARVWVLRDGKPVRSPIAIGLDDGTYAEVVHGDLRPGDQVIVNEVSAGTQSGRGGQVPRPRLHLGA